MDVKKGGRDRVWEAALLGACAVTARCAGDAMVPDVGDTQRNLNDERNLIDFPGAT